MYSLVAAAWKMRLFWPPMEAEMRLNTPFRGDESLYGNAASLLPVRGFLEVLHFLNLLYLFHFYFSYHKVNTSDYV